MLFNRDAPLFLRWSYLPRLLPFLMKYLAHDTDAHVNHYAKSMATLLHDSVDQHQALAAEQALKNIFPRGLLFWLPNPRRCSRPTATAGQNAKCKASNTLSCQAQSTPR